MANEPTQIQTNRELLEECLAAFEAIPAANAAKKFLRRRGTPPRMGAGNGSWQLADVMARAIRSHLQRGSQ